MITIKDYLILKKILDYFENPTTDEEIIMYNGLSNIIEKLEEED